MKRFFVWMSFSLLAAASTLTTTLSFGEPQSSAPRSTKAPATEAFTELEWDDLLPINERGGLPGGEPPPAHEYLREDGPAAMQSGSAAINPALNNTKVKIPGFIVPLKMLPDHTLEEFFLVPYFGACMHLPPPPPNQIVFVRLKKRIPTDSMYGAVWVSGTLKAERKGSRIGSSAYSLDGMKVEPYKE